MKFQDLVNHAPELARIKSDSRNLLANENDPLHWRHYEALKRRMSQYVGWTAKGGLPEEHYTSEAYEIAHSSIFRGLA